MRRRSYLGIVGMGVSSSLAGCGGIGNVVDRTESELESGVDNDGNAPNQEGVTNGGDTVTQTRDLASLGSTWAMLGYDGSNSNYNPGAPEIARKPQVRWEKVRETQVNQSSPGTVLAADQTAVYVDWERWRDTLGALDVLTGELLWTQQLVSDPPGPGPSMVLHAGVIYTAGSGKSYALDSATGDIIWERKLADIPEGNSYEPRYDFQTISKGDNEVYYFRLEKYGQGENFPELISVDIDSGQVNWRTELSFDPINLAVDDDIIFWYGLPDERPALIALDANTGSQMWEISLFENDHPFYDYPSGGIILGNKRLYITLELGFILSLDKEGNVIWRNDDIFTEALYTYSSMAHGQIYTGDRRGLIRAVAAETGNEQWAMPVLDSGAVLGPIVVGDQVVAGSFTADESASIHGLSTHDGMEIWFTEVAGGRVQTPLVVNHGAYAGGTPGMYRAFDIT